MLPDGRRGDVGVLGQLLDCGNGRPRRDQPAYAPPRHAKVFREAVHEKFVVRTTLKAEDRTHPIRIYNPMSQQGGLIVEPLGIGQPLVDFIKERPAPREAAASDRP